MCLAYLVRSVAQPGADTENLWSKGSWRDKGLIWSEAGCCAAKGDNVPYLHGFLDAVDPLLREKGLPPDRPNKDFFGQPAREFVKQFK